MALIKNFHPKQGHYLICDFQRGFVPPEIVKIRPVIVISKTNSHGPHRELCTVTVISTTAPKRVMPWHHQLSFNPNPADSSSPVWVKCDMIYTVSYNRLAKPHKKTYQGGREYLNIKIPKAEVSAILDGVFNYLNHTREHRFVNHTL